MEFPRQLTHDCSFGCSRAPEQWNKLLTRPHSLNWHRSCGKSDVPGWQLLRFAQEHSISPQETLMFTVQGDFYLTVIYLNYFIGLFRATTINLFGGPIIVLDINLEISSFRILWSPRRIWRFSSVFVSLAITHDSGGGVLPRRIHYHTDLASLTSKTQVSLTMWSHYDERKVALFW